MYGCGRMGLRSDFERMRHGGFGQGTSYVPNLVESRRGCWVMCVYVRGHYIELAQGPV